jgi:ribose-phosphate pyrophosphokinase
MNSPLVFSTRTYSQMASEIGWLCAGERGVVESRQFPDGERGQRLVTWVGGRDVVLVGGTSSDEDTLELYDLACGVVDKGARSLSLVIPYFGYSTQERSVHAGEVVTAKTRARLLSAIPVPGSGLRVYLLDLHAEGIPYYFEGSVRAVHIRGLPVITDAIRRITSGSAQFVVACTDAGRAKVVERLANEMRVPASFVLKRRADDGSTAVSAVSAQVEGRHVVIYDDMIRTGGSLIGAAQAYRQAGAARISAIATHGIFPGDALERLRASGLFDCVVCTDSHPRALQLRGDFLKVEPVARLFADFLRSST